MGKKRRRTQTGKLAQKGGNSQHPAVAPPKISGRKAPAKQRKDWKSLAAARLRCWRNNAKARLERFLVVSQTRRFRALTVCLLSFFLFAAGCWCCFVNRIKEVPDWAISGPAIQIVCDKPMKGMALHSSTDDEGKTLLTILEKDASEFLPDLSEAEEHEEYHFWLFINSAEDTPFIWLLDKRIDNVENYKIKQAASDGMQALFARKTGWTENSDTATAFRITFGGDHNRLVQIILYEDEEHMAFRGNGIFRPRLPCVSVWTASNAKSYDGILADYRGRNPSLNSADSMRLSINSEPMYMPLLLLSADYAAASLIGQYELELARISPTPEDGYPLISWNNHSMVLFPMVQFYDREWEVRTKRNNVLGGIFIGLGVNVLFAFNGFSTPKKGRRPDAT